MEYVYPHHFWLMICLAMPIAIHFFIRSKVKILPFSSLFYFKDTLKKRSDKVRFSQKLLLLMRLLMIVMVSVCAVGVYFQGVPSFISNTGSIKKVIYVLDGSMSLSRVVNGQSIWQHLKHKLKQDMDRFQSEDQLTVFLGSDPVNRLSPFWVKHQAVDVKHIFLQWTLSHKSDDFNSAMDQIQSMAKSKWHDELIQIIGVTDMEGYRYYTQSRPVSKNNTSVRFLVPDENMRFEGFNVYIDSIELSDVIQNLYQSRWNVRVHLKVSGDYNHSVLIEVKRNGETIENRPLVLKGDTLAVDFFLPIHSKAGSDVLSFTVNGDDIRFDDVYYYKLPDAKDISIYVLNSETGDTSYLHKAFQTFKHTYEAREHPIHVNVVSDFASLYTKQENINIAVIPDLLTFLDREHNQLQALESKQWCIMGFLNGGGEGREKTFSMNHEWYYLNALPNDAEKYAVIDLHSLELPELKAYLSTDVKKMAFIPKWSIKTSDKYFGPVIRSTHSDSVLLFETRHDLHHILLFNAEMTKESLPFITTEPFVVLLYSALDYALKKMWSVTEYEVGSFIASHAGMILKDQLGREMPAKYFSEKAQEGWFLHEPGVISIQNDETSVYKTVNILPRESDFIKKSTTADTDILPDQNKQSHADKQGKLDLGVVLLWLLLFSLLLEIHLIRILRP